MTKPLYIFLALLSSHCCCAQVHDYSIIRYQYPVGSYYHMLTHYSQDTFIMENKIKSVTICGTHIRRNGKTRKDGDCVSVVYDSLGYPVRDIELDSKGKTKYEVNRVFTAKGDVISGVLTRSDRIVEEQYQHFNDSGQLLSFEKYKKKRLDYSRKYTYLKKKLQRIYFYEKDTNNYQSYYNYYYENDTGRLLMAEMIDRKGNRKHTWDYSCNDAIQPGAKLAKKETRICQSKVQLPNGHTQEIWIQQYPKYIGRWVSELDSNGKMFSEEYFNGKYGEHLSRRTLWTYSDSGDQKLIRTYHTKKDDVIIREHLVVYYGDGKLRKTLWSHFRASGKQWSGWKTQYEYQGDYLILVTGESILRSKYGKNRVVYTYDKGHNGSE